MFNRANKMTALLVAAAAVVSLVPATGVNAADVKRISSEDGKVYNAVAYKDGKFYVDGEINDKDEAVYYLNDGKYNEIENIDSGDSIATYGEKYVNVEDGDYYVDLTNGKVTDDDLADDNKDDAETALKKKVKDKADDRYANHDAPIGNLEEVKGNKFGETWYEGSYERESDTNGNLDKLNIYTDAKGNYIDADYNLGKVKVEISATTPGSVKDLDKNISLDNTDSKKQAAKNKETNTKLNVTAQVDKVKTLGQDSKNIYRLVKVTVTADDGITIEKVDGKIVNGDKKVNGFNVTGNNVSFNAIQKISKDQASDTIDGAKYAKTVNTYVLSTDAGIIEKDVADFGKLISGEEYKAGEISSIADGVKFTVANGTVIAYKATNDSGSQDKLKVQSLNLKSKDGIYYTDVNGDSEEDMETALSYDIDVDGNLWRLEGGFIYKFDNEDDWDKTYKVDGSMDELSVYNKDNMVVWNEDDEVYSVIGAKEKEEEKPEVEVKAGWTQAADGTWTFVKDGVKATGWFQDGANWYLANGDGIMQTGWQTVGGTWYYLAGNGAMQTGWQNVNGAWYYLLGNGAMQTGWINDNGTWYFCDGSGKMLANTTVNGYVLGANGAWVK
ncbi:MULTISPECIES: N-acetylmuramoyl-L-alanine amidase family protein [unclassified Clostridium]|uniref:N-acetylmuramoyl-L-alanine amidase family protein n=1 Tax=unclassified Clostridium TaxID=2614128 RepID=UPI00207AAD23|nr:MULTISPECIES: N-acetylmuramoyl-L-alanine amidase family protein [unclassified Clostridium]